MTDKGKAMNPSPYTEDTAVKYLKQQLKWESSIYAYNNEDNVPGSLPRFMNREVTV